VEVIQEVCRCHIELLLKGIGGEVCRKKYKSMLKNVISAKNLLRTFINQEGYSVHCLVHGYLLNGAWTLWDHFPGM